MMQDHSDEVPLLYPEPVAAPPAVAVDTLYPQAPPPPVSAAPIGTADFPPTAAEIVRHA
jgi:hypothetical protein